MIDHPTDDLAAFAIGALDRPDAVRVEAHLAGCATCRAEVASFDEVAWGIAELAPAVGAGEGLRERVVARAARRLDASPRDASPRTRGASIIGRLLTARVPLAVPLALTVVLAVALVGLQAARSDADGYARAIAGVAAGSVVTLSATPGTDARGTLVVPDAGAAYLILRVAPPPAGKTWEAWVIRGDRPIPAGITGERSGVVTLLLSEPVRPGDAVAVTLEDAGGVPAPRGPIVLQGRT